LFGLLLPMMVCSILAYSIMNDEVFFCKKMEAVCLSKMCAKLYSFIPQQTKSSWI
jgi:hypothetical protein